MVLLSCKLLAHGDESGFDLFDLVGEHYTLSSKTAKEHLRAAATYQKRFAYVWISGPGVASLSFGFQGPPPEVIDARQNRYSQALDDMIEYLNEDIATAAAALPSVTQQEDREPRNPYKGLRAFTIGDAGDFFGCIRLIDNLASRVQRLVTEQPHRAGNRLLAARGSIRYHSPAHHQQ
jgi:hypothetical protein